MTDIASKPGAIRVASVANSFPGAAQVTIPLNYMVGVIGVQLESGSDYVEISFDGTNVAHRIPVGGLPWSVKTASRSVWLRSGAGSANAIVTVA